MIPTQEQPQFIGDLYKQVKSEVPDELELESLDMENKEEEGTKISLELSDDNDVSQEINATVGGE